MNAVLGGPIAGCLTVVPPLRAGFLVIPPQCFTWNIALGRPSSRIDLVDLLIHAPHAATESPQQAVHVDMFHVEHRPEADITTGGRVSTSPPSPLRHMFHVEHAGRTRGVMTRMKWGCRKKRRKEEAKISEKTCVVHHVKCKEHRINRAAIAKNKCVFTTLPYPLPKKRPFF